jgi:glycosyltransferase involved in cell wall biosynthesis
MLAVHRARRTWHRDVDAFIALTAFGRDRFVAGGLPADRLLVKPNFAPDPGKPDGDEASGQARYGRGPFLFVGRLTVEKGIRPLLAAWRLVDGERELRIVGDGPLAGEVRAAAGSVDGVTLVGPRSREEVLAEMRSARALIFPSLWYEGMPAVSCHRATQRPWPTRLQNAPERRATLPPWARPPVAPTSTPTRRGRTTGTLQGSIGKPWNEGPGARRRGNGPSTRHGATFW